MKMLSLLVSRQFLAFVALIAVALLVWFVGPLVALGETRPLTGVGVRIMMLALLTGALLLRLAGAPPGPALAALACLLIWYAAPFVGFGALRPFAPAWLRATLIAALLGLCAVYWLLRFWQRLRSDEQFLRKALAFGGQKQGSMASMRLQVVEAQMGAVLKRLKAMRTEASGFARLFQPAGYLYEVPWYIVLGAGGSGKTSLLLNAGLTFPEHDPIREPADTATANVEWRLSNRAVLIDTAGYYTQHGTSSLAMPAASPSNAPGGARMAVRASAARTGASAVRVGVAPPAAAIGTLSPALHADFDARTRLDADEWFGFLALLRKHRTRAPLNGALLVVDCASLASADNAAFALHAAALRARLAELRERLGIRFPVYLFVTQMDCVPGFADYFSSLPTAACTQEWGFTLPAHRTPATADSLVDCCATEFALLAAHLADGVDARLSDEHDVHRRRRLLALPTEFGALAAPLCQLLERVFADSRYDFTQAHAALRGVYFTSARQDGRDIAVERHTVMQRLARHPHNTAPPHERQRSANDSFFLHDVFSRIVLPEAHLVRANLRWEHRSRVVSWLAHLLAILLFTGLAAGLLTSYANNQSYLDAAADHAEALATRIARLRDDAAPAALSAALDAAHALPVLRGLDPDAPDSTYRYGLFTGPAIVIESARTYETLAEHMLLPHVMRRLEHAIRQGIARNDPKATYSALRIYLMLSDPAKFSASEVHAWLENDSTDAEGAATPDGYPGLAAHVAQLFSGKRLTQTPPPRDDALIERARDYLDGGSAVQRLYERAKAAMQREAPDDFTLLRAIGPQAGLLFTRASGASLGRGVPGLYTFDGYRHLFDKQLPEFVRAAREDDAWVIGQARAGSAAHAAAAPPAAPAHAAPPQIAATAAAATAPAQSPITPVNTDLDDDPLTAAIRRQYLLDYAREWETFLGDIRSVAGTNLAASLRTLRSFAAPDSPLGHLMRAAVHETSLTQPANTADQSLLQKAGAQLGRKTGAWLGMRSEARLERELVDTRFGGLREIATGSADPSALGEPSGGPGGGKTGFDGIVALLNDYFNALSAAELALANHSMPPASDTAARLKMAADTLPAPLREVLRGLAMQGSREVNEGIGRLLSRQLDAVVSDACRHAVEGNYPFVRNAARDIRIEDFTRVFAQEGLLDGFFIKHLAPFVDTAARPWRYRTLPGSTQPVQGPDLEPFQHAQAIRDTFFGAQNHQQMSWNTDIRVVSLDPTVTSLTIDIDGQADLYRHGPVRPFNAAWPGPRGGAHAELSASPRIRPETSTVAADGPWALLRLLDKAAVADTATPGRTRVAFDFDGRRAVLDLASPGGVANPLTSDVLRTFRCPTSMPAFALPDDGPPPGLPRAHRLMTDDG